MLSLPFCDCLRTVFIAFPFALCPATILAEVLILRHVIDADLFLPLQRLIQHEQSIILLVFKMFWGVSDCNVLFIILDS
jgi:hypothetical protein